MRTTWATLASAILAISALARSPALPAQQAGHADAIARDRAQWQVLETYCFECHNSSDWAGGLALDLFSPESVPQDADAFEKVIRKLRGRTMPPPGEDRPTDAQYSGLSAWLEQSLDRAAAQDRDPGWAGLHRLNRREYANAVYDLLGLDWIDAANMLPADTPHDGFDNIASALVTPPGFPASTT